MGPVSAVRPLLQPFGGAGGTLAQSEPAGSSRANPIATATVAQNGARNLAAAAAETSRPVVAAEGTARSSPHMADKGHLIEAARERAEAAHRAYTMTMLALGQNPLSDPVP